MIIHSEIVNIIFIRFVLCLRFRSDLMELNEVHQKYRESLRMLFSENIHHIIKTIFIDTL